MTRNFDLTPLARWDGFHLVLHLPAIEGLIRDRLADVESLSDPALSGSGDIIRMQATVRVKGIASRVEIEMSEVRLRMRRLGFRLGRIRVMRGLPLPRSVVEMAIEKAAPEIVRVIRGSGIVVVDLRRWLPEETDLKIVALQIMGERIHLWFGPGFLSRIAASERALLAPGEE